MLVPCCSFFCALTVLTRSTQSPCNLCSPQSSSRGSEVHLIRFTILLPISIHLGDDARSTCDYPQNYISTVGFVALGEHLIGEAHGLGYFFFRCRFLCYYAVYFLIGFLCALYCLDFLSTISVAQLPKSQLGHSGSRDTVFQGLFFSGVGCIACMDGISTMTGVNGEDYEQYDHDDWDWVLWLAGVCESKN